MWRRLNRATGERTGGKPKRRRRLYLCAFLGLTTLALHSHLQEHSERLREPTPAERQAARLQSQAALKLLPAFLQ